MVLTKELQNLAKKNLEELGADMRGLMLRLFVLGGEECKTRKGRIY